MPIEQAKQALIDAAKDLESHGVTRSTMTAIIRDGLGPGRSDEEIREKAIEHLRIARDLLKGVAPAIVSVSYRRNTINIPRALTTASRKVDMFIDLKTSSRPSILDEANSEVWLDWIEQALAASETTG